MVEETVLNSIMLLDKCILNKVRLINELDGMEYEKIMNSNVINKINIVLKQIDAIKNVN